MPSSWRCTRRRAQPHNPSHLGATAEAYRIKGERLLLWCVLEHQKALSLMTAAACSACLRR